MTSLVPAASIYKRSLPRRNHRKKQESCPTPMTGLCSASNQTGKHTGPEVRKLPSLWVSTTTWQGCWRQGRYLWRRRQCQPETWASTEVLWFPDSVRLNAQRSSRHQLTHPHSSASSSANGNHTIYLWNGKSNRTPHSTYTGQCLWFVIVSSGDSTRPASIGSGRQHWKPFPQPSPPVPPCLGSRTSASSLSPKSKVWACDALWPMGLLRMFPGELMKIDNSNKKEYTEDPSYFFSKTCDLWHHALKQWLPGFKPQSCPFSLTQS